MRPDTRAHTIWDTIRNTIEDPSLTLYLVLDEAHRGMGNPSSAAEAEKSTLVKRLINGEKGVPGIPVVLGISATVERFTRATDRDPPTPAHVSNIRAALHWAIKPKYYSPVSVLPKQLQQPVNGRSIHC
jgi:superfamily II DNA or RNA helicase